MYDVTHRRGWFATNWPWLVFLITIAALVQQYTANQSVQDKIDHAIEVEAMRSEKEALQANITKLIGEQVTLQGKLETAYFEISKGLHRIEELAGEQELNKLTVRLLKTDAELVQTIRETYPAVARAQSLGVIELQDDGGIILPYLSVPLWFAETFVLEHNELDIARQQLAEYESVTAQYGEARALHEQVLTLEQQKSQAYQDGYQAATGRYDTLSTKYEACLNKPRFDIPDTWVIAGSAVAGFVGCTALQGKISW